MDKLDDLLQRLIELQGNIATRKCSQIKKVDGFDRYFKAVANECKFVQSMKLGQKEVTKSRILSSNVTLFESIFDVFQRETGVVAIGQPFTLDGKLRALTVDIVSENGCKWVKVKAMSSKSIEDLYEGRGRFGERSVVEIAADYLRCASQNIVNFGVPKVEFAFSDLPGIPAGILQQLRAAGISVTSTSSPASARDSMPAPSPPTPTKVVDDDESDEDAAYHYILPPALIGVAYAIDPATVRRVNMDITALIALTSELTHGGCIKAFPGHPVLQRQAEDEVRRPVLKRLNAFLEDKELVVCCRAAKEFEDILNVVGGPEERVRGTALLAKCTQVPDQPSPMALDLHESRRIKARQKVVFGTGDHLQAITLTANVSFVRAAQDQGAHFAVFTHPSRALTEMKGLWPN